MYPAITMAVNIGPARTDNGQCRTFSGGGETQPSTSGPDRTTIVGRPQLTMINRILTR